MVLPPLDSCHQDESNGGKFIRIQSLDRAPTSIIIKCLWHINFVNIDASNMILPPLDSSHQVESNGGKCIRIQSLDRASTSIIIKCL